MTERNLIAIDFEGVSVVRRSKAILSQVSLSVMKGEVFAIVGRSGSGKSTILRCMAGNMRCDTGKVSAFGDDPAYLVGVRRRMATVWQSRALFPHMTALANVEFGLRVRGIPRPERMRRALDLLDQFGMRRHANVQVSVLSGGEQQRVAIARAMIVEPKILFLDEPFTGLDHVLKSELQRDLRSLVARGGCTYILVSHDLDDIFSLADRVAVIEGGRVLQIDTPAQVSDHPASAFVARFVGRHNVIPGIVRSIDEGTSGHIAELEVEEGLYWRGVSREQMTIGESVYYIVSPEALAEGSSGECVAEGTCVGSETWGAFRETYIRLTSGRELRMLERRVDEGPWRARGVEVQVTWPLTSGLVLRRRPEDAAL